MRNPVLASLAASALAMVEQLRLPPVGPVSLTTLAVPVAVWPLKIGRGAGRERVEISVAAGILKKKAVAEGGRPVLGLANGGVDQGVQAVFVFLAALSGDV